MTVRSKSIEFSKQFGNGKSQHSRGPRGMTYRVDTNLSGCYWHDLPDEENPSPNDKVIGLFKMSEWLESNGWSRTESVYTPIDDFQETWINGSIELWLFIPNFDCIYMDDFDADDSELKVVAFFHKQ